MLLQLVASAALVLPTAGSPPPAEDHGKLPWFEGTFAEVLAKAEAENKLVFIDFWADWCGWCKRLDKDTFSDDAVVATMKDFLCFSVDTESETGQPIAERFSVRPLPTLIVLEPDGTVRDRWSGYLPPDGFILEIERIVRNEGTVGALTKAVEANPKDLEARWALAQKLQQMGDESGFEAQVAAIVELDPKGEHPISRRMKLAQLSQAALSSPDPQATDLLAFLDGETDSKMLFEGHELITRICSYRLKKDTGEAADGHAKQLVASYRIAWKHCPEEYTSSFGNGLAWSFWTQRERLDAEAKAFALEVIEKAAELSPEDANLLDTLACTLFMNGQQERAIEVAEKCVALAPDNAEFKERLQTFRGTP